jgi:hypothetical protein
MDSPDLSSDVYGNEQTCGQQSGIVYSSKLHHHSLSISPNSPERDAVAAFNGESTLCTMKDLKDYSIVGVIALFSKRCTFPDCFRTAAGCRHRKSMTKSE